jgi:16S rRNA (guanine966-N2)-methyltransferase
MSLRIYGNRLIQTLPGDETRPTSSKVREAIFNIWQGTIEGCRWLDLCAGSGAMGAEALCRGAVGAIGIEKNPDACEIARLNWKRFVKPPQEARVIRGNVVSVLPTLNGQQFDRIYFDPPYKGELYEVVLTAIIEFKLLAADGEIAVEHAPGRSISIGGLVICREKRYGNTAITFLAPIGSHPTEDP